MIDPENDIIFVHELKHNGERLIAASVSTVFTTVARPETWKSSPEQVKSYLVSLLWRYIYGHIREKLIDLKIKIETDKISIENVKHEITSLLYDINEPQPAAKNGNHIPT